MESSNYFPATSAEKETRMAKHSAKTELLHAVLKLFSGYGRENGSTRDLARMIESKMASIRKHFLSRRDIPNRIHELYVQRRQSAVPLESLLRLAESESVQDVLLKLDYHFPLEFQNMLDRILAGASRGIAEEDSGNSIHKQLFDAEKALLVPLLNRLIALGKIESIDADGFICLVFHYAYGVAALNRAKAKSAWSHAAATWKRSVAAWNRATTARP